MAAAGAAETAGFDSVWARADAAAFAEAGVHRIVVLPGPEADGGAVEAL
jgi:hypothetical protein